jgi:hypothetical protein
VLTAGRPRTRVFGGPACEFVAQKLLKKVKSQADEVDVQAPKHAETERSRLEAIVGKYKMTKTDIDAIVAWRHADDH